MTVCCQPDESSAAVAGRRRACIGDLLRRDVVAHIHRSGRRE
jgi:hypothetical protein